MKRCVSTFGMMFVAALIAVPAMAQSPAVPVRSALEPATTGGIEVVDRALAKLSTHRRLLMIGAHPDDEDTSILALVSRGLGGEAAYLALSRGDGGQNLIGPELGVGLGVIRTQELVAARQADGAHQFFTRAYDFGYIRSLEETLERWPREVMLEDAARVIWRFRPQVVVAMFTPEGGGHGQHKASGWTAAKVFPVAGEEARFPSLVEEGWQPWQPEAFFRRMFFNPERASMRFSLGGIEALSGRSMLQIAMKSRSQHRSQDMGMLQPLGTRRGGVEWVAGPGGAGTDNLFAGIDTRLAAIAAPIADEDVRSTVKRELELAEKAARATRTALSPADLDGSVSGFVEILAALDRARDAAGQEVDASARRIVTELIEEKIAIGEAGLAAAAGLGLEATSEREAVAPGQVSGVTVQVWNAGSSTLAVDSVTVAASDHWTVQRREGESGPVEADALVEWTLEAGVEADARPTVPYYLERPRVGDLYDWTDATPDFRGLPGQSPELVAEVALTVAGRQIVLYREVVCRTRDQAVGEVRRPVRIVPQLEVAVDPSLALWNIGRPEQRDVRITLRSHLEIPVAGRLVAETPPGWAEVSAEFGVLEPGGQEAVELRLAQPDGLLPGLHDLRFEARIEEGGSNSLAVPLMEYEHIRPTPLPAVAEMRVSAFDLALPEVGPIGYVRGASDRVPEFLRQVGLDVELLDAIQLAQGDLSRFRVIVVGSRAYETDTALVAANARLLEFARGGGLLVVQYQQYQFVRGEYAPYRLEIERPHDRITDETAPVRILEPQHSVFSTPNRLNESDWEGWVQERGLYFAHSWDEAYTPLLAMHDPGMGEQSGGLLLAPVGDGLYVYTGLAFFRQLPAGVAGGYRLFVNILALAEHL